MDINGLGEKVAGFSLVQSSMAAAAQFRVLQPVECEQRPFDAADFRQREVDPVLAAVGREFFQNQRWPGRKSPSHPFVRARASAVSRADTNAANETPELPGISASASPISPPEIFAPAS